MPAAYTLTVAILVAASSAPPTDGAASASTVSAMRDTGTAMLSWLTDQVEDGMPQIMMRGATQQANGTTVLNAPTAKDSLDWSSCTATSYAEVARELAPFYIREVVAYDGWGHPLEFCLSKVRANDPQFVLGIRSPGRDGKFDGTTYERGSFDAERYDRDIVWLDGFFLAWPERK